MTFGVFEWKILGRNLYKEVPILTIKDVFHQLSCFISSLHYIDHWLHFMLSLLIVTDYSSKGINIFDLIAYEWENI